MENTPQTLLNVCGITDEEARQIGSRLKEKRINTIDHTTPDQTECKTTAQIAQALHIRKNYIESIESGDWSTLPNGGPGRSLIRMYARELNVALPEFEKFKNTQTMQSTSVSDNLKNIVECAREKHAEQNSGLRFNPSGISDKFKSLFAFKKIQSKKSYASASKINFKRVLILGSSVFAVTAITIIGFKNNDKSSVDTEVQSESIADDTNTQQDTITTDANVQQDVMTADTVTSNAVTADANSQQNSIPNSATVPPAPIAAEINTQQTQPTSETINVQQTQPTEKKETKPLETATTQKTKIDILSPVVVRIESDGKQIMNGLAQPGTIDIEFQKQATLFLQDSSKVKLSFAGWTQERLSMGPRERTIVLNAKKFSDEN